MTGGSREPARGARGSIAGPDRTAARAIALLLLPSVGVAIASFLNADLTRNDFRRFADPRLTFLFFALFCAASLAYAALCLEPVRLSRRVVVGGAMLAGAALLASFPLGSKDVFLYAFFGKVWNTYGANPYLTPPAAFPADPWHPFVAHVIWAGKPAPYGPLFLWQARWVDALAGGHLFAATWLFKATAAAALAGAVAFAARLLEPCPERWHRIALLAWNPLLLFESAGSGHNDATMVLFVLASLWWHRRGGAWRTIAAPAALALAFWYKWYGLLFLPALAIAVHREGEPGARRRWATSALLSFTGIGLVLFAPFLPSAPNVALRLLHHENLHRVFPLQLSPVLAPLLLGLDRAGLIGGAGGRYWFDVARFALFAAGAAAVLACQWRGLLSVVESMCLLSVAFTMLVVSVLWPWHLEVPIALALVAGRARWRWLGLALTVLALLSYFLTFEWAAALILPLAAALWAFRRTRGGGHRDFEDPEQRLPPPPTEA